MEIRKCSNCKRRLFSGWDGWLESCLDYEIATTEAEEIKAASNCQQYEYGMPSCLKEQDGGYCPSATCRDYSPSNPWDAPGMSVRDFI